MVIAVCIVGIALYRRVADRSAPRFFDAPGGGDPVIVQHLFWFLGQPDVYMWLAPILGIVAYGVFRFFKTSMPLIMRILIALIAGLFAGGLIAVFIWVQRMYVMGMG